MPVLTPPLPRRPGNARLMRTAVPQYGKPQPNAVPRYADEEQLPTGPLRMPATKPAATPGIVGTAATPSPNPITPPSITGLKPSYQPAGRGGIDVKSYAGSRYAPGGGVPKEGYTPQPTFEDSADRILRGRFGAPPNERGQTDVQPGGLVIPSTKQAVDAWDKTGTPARAAVPPPYSTPAPAGEEVGEPAGLADEAGEPPVAGAASPSIAPPITPSTPKQPQPQQQTEAANPLTGDRTGQPDGTTAPLPTGTAAGFSSRGGAVPKGQDATTLAGSGLYARRFSNPVAANTYAQFTRRLFGDQ